MSVRLVLRTTSPEQAVQILEQVQRDGWDARPLKDEGTGTWLIEVPLRDEPHADVAKAKLSLVLPPNVGWETIRAHADRLRDPSA